MKKRELADIRKKTLKDLIKQVDKGRADLLKEKINISAGKSKNIRRIRNVKQDIAQILTVIREKELVEELDRKQDIAKTHKNKKTKN
jgi:ribosomal protein L29